MFTGLIEDIGVVAAVVPRVGGLGIAVATRIPPGELLVGDSIAVDGCCLTVVHKDGDKFSADVADESLRRTTLGRLVPGDRVNLERAVLASTRLGGHVVQGHVDGVAEILERRRDGEALRLTIRAGPELTRYMVEKGAITIDGISLTLTAVDATTASVMLVPHTRRATWLAEKAVGEPVNVEVDVLAKYVERLAGRLGPPQDPRSSRSDAPRQFEGTLVVPPGARFVLLASRFNHFIVDRLVEGALDAIRRHGGATGDVDIVRVPGAWELPVAAGMVARRGGVDAIIALGAVIRGATPHFDLVAGEMMGGLGGLSLQTGIPVAVGVLTTDSIEQAIERAGTKHGNKGWDAALAAIEMVSLRAALVA